MSTSISRGSQINSLSTKATLEQRNNSIKSNFNNLREAVKSSKEKNKVKHSLDKLQNQASFARNQLQAYGSDYGFVRWDIVWEGCTSLVPCYESDDNDWERTIRELQTKLWDAMNTYLSKSWWLTNTFRIPYWIYYIRG